MLLRGRSLFMTSRADLLFAHRQTDDRHVRIGSDEMADRAARLQDGMHGFAGDFVRVAGSTFCVFGNHSGMFDSEGKRGQAKHAKCEESTSKLTQP